MASYAEYLRKALKDSKEKLEAEKSPADASDKAAPVAAKLEKSRAASASASSGNIVTEEQLSAELDRIDDMYKVSVAEDLPDPVKYDRLEYDAPTDEEIAASAKSALEDYRVSEISGIETDAENRIRDKENEKISAEKLAEETAAETRARYDEAVSDFERDVLKRGLARSSIAVNGSEELQSDKAGALTEISAAAAGEIVRLDGEISALESDKQKALSDFNIAYAAKLAEKIAELTAEREEKQAEVTKYNNTLAEKEREDELALLKLYGSLAETDGKVPEDKLAEFYEAKYDAIRNYLSGLDADIASREIRDNPLLRNSVSDYYYYRLYNEFARSSV